MRSQFLVFFYLTKIRLIVRATQWIWGLVIETHYSQMAMELVKTTKF